MTVIFNKNFYNLKAIKKAIGAFKKLAYFKIEENNKTYRILIRNIDEEIKGVIEDEFSNYILAEMKNGKRN